MRRDSPSALLSVAVGLALALALAPGFASPLPAQEDAGRIPRPSAGVPTLLMPVQRTEPLPDGAWPAGAQSRRDLLGRMDAELSFALEGDERAGAWTSPRGVRRLAGRNPLLDVDPRHLAVDALPEAGEKLPGPLHGQLRGLAALADARFVILPVRLVYRREADGRRPCPWRRAEERGEEAGGAGPDAAEAAAGRAILCLAVVDVRSTRILWRGQLAGPPSEPDAPDLLARLAERVTELLVR